MPANPKTAQDGYEAPAGLCAGGARDLIKGRSSSPALGSLRGGLEGCVVPVPWSGKGAVARVLSKGWPRPLYQRVSLFPGMGTETAGAKEMQRGEEGTEISPTFTFQKK